MTTTLHPLPRAAAAQVPPSTPEPSALDRAITEADLDRLFELFLGRPVADDAYRASKAASGISVADAAAELLASPELAFRFRSHPDELLDGPRFRVPDQLTTSHVAPRCVTLVGSCAFDPFYDQLVQREPDTQFRKITFNNGSTLPPIDAAGAAAIDFQLVQLPIRTVMPEHMYFNDSVTEESARAWFEVSRSLMLLNFEAATAYNREHGVETYVMNFLLPQQNPLGRVQNPYTLRNPVFFVAELNRYLWEQIERCPNMFLIDAEQIAASLGKRYIQDDSVTHLNHGSTLVPIGMAGDEARIEPVGDVPTLYGAQVANFNAAVYAEALAAHRALHGRGAIKLVIFDLDDTLWRGVAAERLDSLDHTMTEGWPLGVLEAVSFLHKRGIMLGIVSKNDAANAEQVWQALHHHRFPLDHFIARRINWEPKAQNVREIIALANVAPDAVLFVDDNPVERAHVRDGVPGIRTLDASLAEWRRILLWSGELQPAAITDEALGRAASIRAKADRDTVAGVLDQQSFLAQLELQVRPHVVRDLDDPGFPRCLELINKTNQFNTTGRRWTAAELGQLFADGGWLLTLSVRDRYAQYGLTGIAICRPGEIVQYLMSCRIFGMGVEQAALALALSSGVAAAAGPVTARTADTGRNHLSHDLFARAGFAAAGEGDWRLPPDASLAVPAHITVADA